MDAIDRRRAFGGGMVLQPRLWPEGSPLPSGADEMEGEDELIRLYGEDWMEKNFVVITNENLYPGIEAGWMICTLCDKQLAGYWTCCSHFEGRQHRKYMDWYMSEACRDGAGMQALPAAFDGSASPRSEMSSNANRYFGYNTADVNQMPAAREPSSVTPRSETSSAAPRFFGYNAEVQNPIPNVSDLPFPATDAARTLAPAFGAQGCMACMQPPPPPGPPPLARQPRDVRQPLHPMPGANAPGAAGLAPPHAGQGHAMPAPGPVPQQVPPGSAQPPPPLGPPPPSRPALDLRQVAAGAPGSNSTTVPSSPSSLTSTDKSTLHPGGHALMGQRGAAASGACSGGSDAAGVAPARGSAVGPKSAIRKVTTEYDGAEVGEGTGDAPEAGYLPVSPGDIVEILCDEADGHGRNRYGSYVFGRKKTHGVYTQGWLPAELCA